MIQDYEGVIFLDSDHDDDRTDNRPSCFHVFMSSPFSFSRDDFEVGLHEVQIPYTWSNVTQREWYGIFDKDWCGGFHFIDPGCYYNVVDLINSMNIAFRGPLERNPPRLVYDPEFRRIRAMAGVHGNHKRAYIRMTKGLAQMLGYSDTWFSFTGELPIEREVSLPSPDFRLEFVGPDVIMEYATADRPVNLQFQLPRLYITSSIVKHPAHRSVDLLRAIPVNLDRKFGDIDVLTYDRPIFVPLAHQTFDRIEIKICDHRGQELEFASGNVVLALEFRRRRDAF